MSPDAEKLLAKDEYAKKPKQEFSFKLKGVDPISPKKNIKPNPSQDALKKKKTK